MPPNDFRVSTYTPWYRRWFVNERNRELEETRDLYQRVAFLHGQYAPEPKEMLTRVFNELPDLPEPYGYAFFETIAYLIGSEDFIFKLPSGSFDGMTLKEFAAYRNLLQKKLRFFETKDHLLPLAEEFLVELFSYLAQDLPSTETPSPFTIPLLNALSEPKNVIQNTCYFFSMEPYRERGLFEETREQIADNAYASRSGISRALRQRRRIAQQMNGTSRSQAFAFSANCPSGRG